MHELASQVRNGIVIWRFATKVLGPPVVQVVRELKWIKNDLIEQMIEEAYLWYVCKMMHCK